MPATSGSWWPGGDWHWEIAGLCSSGHSLRQTTEQEIGDFYGHALLAGAANQRICPYFEASARPILASPAKGASVTAVLSAWRISQAKGSNWHSMNCLRNARIHSKSLYIESFGKPIVMANGAGIEIAGRPSSTNHVGRI